MNKITVTYFDTPYLTKRTMSKLYIGIVCKLSCFRSNLEYNFAHAQVCLSAVSFPIRRDIFTLCWGGGGIITLHALIIHIPCTTFTEI